MGDRWDSSLTPSLTDFAVLKKDLQIHGNNKATAIRYVDDRLTVTEERYAEEFKSWNVKNFYGPGLRLKDTTDKQIYCGMILKVMEESGILTCAPTRPRIEGLTFTHSCEFSQKSNVIGYLFRVFYHTDDITWWCYFGAIIVDSIILFGQRELHRDNIISGLEYFLEKLGLDECIKTFTNLIKALFNRREIK